MCEISMKFPIRKEPAWELWPDPFHFERRFVPSSGIYVSRLISWGDDDDEYIAMRKRLSVSTIYFIKIDFYFNTKSGNLNFL